RAIDVVLELCLLVWPYFGVCLVGPHTNVAHICCSINMCYPPPPGSACGGTISLCRQPAILDPGNHRKRKHAGARSLRPDFRMIDELTPQSIVSLILEQRRHHLSITFQYARALRVLLRQRTQQLSHPRCYPTIAASPVKS